MSLFHSEVRKGLSDEGLRNVLNSARFVRGRDLLHCFAVLAIADRKKIGVSLLFRVLHVRDRFLVLRINIFSTLKQRF